MANNYSHFAQDIPLLTEEEKRWIEEVLNLTPFVDGEIDNEEEAEALKDKLGVSELNMESWPGCHWSFYGQDGTYKLLLQDDGGHFDWDPLSVFVQAFLRKFRPRSYFTVSSADTCDKPRSDNFGGGWMVITKDKVMFGSTWKSIALAVSTIEKEKIDGNPT